MASSPFSPLLILLSSAGLLPNDSPVDSPGPSPPFLTPPRAPFLTPPRAAPPSLPNPS